MQVNLSLIFTIFSVLLFSDFVQAQSIEGFTWQEVHNVDLGAGVNHFTIEAASSGLGGEVELRLDAADGTVIGRTFFHHTGDPGYFLDYECDLSQTISGIHDIYMNFQDYSDPDSGSILKIGNFQFSLFEEPPGTWGDSLHIYPPVPGLDPSPYYEIYIQKVSKLNSSNLNEVTNWETPFAWFTQCPDNAPDGNNKGYYSRFVGGWSNTYTNFELDPNTPIVVKIVRKNDTGDDAPAGPIDTAVVRPSNKVDSWELIDGDIYITMSQPALVGVDIDGQMEMRISPRATPTGWDSSAFPYSNKKDGTHTVTIFANPFIEDKPKPSDPGVFVVKAGEKIPSTEELLNQDWDILYFEPGVHRASVNVDPEGNLIERRWQAEDPITLQDNKSYYIPGDAIVYANFTDINRSNDQSVNIRIFGHGTISGSKINHNSVEGEAYSNDGWWNRALYVRNAQNCHYEGITAVDPAFHTLCIVASVDKTYEPNTIKWTKVLAWRTNSDGTAVSGNTQMEDCFIRCQDDGHYIGGTTRMERVVFWHDVNGQTFRGDFTNRRYSGNNAPNIPKLIIYEDIDVIYARGVFSTSNSSGFSIMGVNGGTNNSTLEGGVENSGQMVYFRNINISDPLPCRKLISFDVEEKVGDYAGIRFENIHYQGKQVFGWKNWLVGSNNAAIRNFVFDNVTINGEVVDQKYVNDPTNFGTDSAFDISYRRRDTISSTGHVLTSTATNGWITIKTEGTPGEVSLTATPISGYKFTGWSGDLAGTDSIVTITIDSDKAITANFSLITYSISTTAINGTIKLDPAADSYLPGTIVTVTAVGDLGFGLDSWGDDLSGTENPVTITMNGDKAISASFKEVPTYMLNISSDFGSVILDPPGGEYNPGTDVTLIPESNPGYYFEQWFGDLDGSDNPATVMMDADKTVDARFVFAGWGTTSNAINFGGPDYDATDGTSYSGDNNGSNYSTSASISGTEDEPLYQTERYGKTFSIDIPVNNGSYQVTLMFAEIFHSSAGSRVFSVSIEEEEVINNLDIFSVVGKNVAYNETYEVTIVDGELNITFTTAIDNAKISAIKVVSNIFEGKTYTLTMEAPVNGTLTSDPPEGPYPEGSNVLLTATPDSGYKFTGWSGDLSSVENPVILYMNDNKNVSATFIETNWYNLTTSATNGTIIVDPEEGIYGYTEGTQISLIANPDEGYYFTGWGGDLEGTETDSTSIIMDRDKIVIANFEKIAVFTLTVNAINGSVELLPDGGKYEDGTIVSLKAVPNIGYAFYGWNGDLLGEINPTTITMDSDKEITAEFINPNSLSLTINSVNGSVNVFPDQEVYNRGTAIILTATPDDGFEFMGWEGDLTGSDNPVSFVINSNISITAVFSKATAIGDHFTDNSAKSILIQNYPNPFSTVTTIQYELSKGSDVKLTIYNLLGHQVATLVDEYQIAGPHSIKWFAQDNNGKTLATGLYIYRLEVDNNTIQLKKASLIK